MADREIARPAQELGHSAGDDADQVHQHQDQHDRDHFRHDYYPIGGRGGIDYLVQLAIALPPNQLAAIEDGDHQQEQREALAEGIDDIGGQRVRRGAVHDPAGPKVGSRVEYRQQQDDDQAGTL